MRRQDVAGRTVTSRPNLRLARLLSERLRLRPIRACRSCREAGRTRFGRGSTAVRAATLCRGSRELRAHHGGTTARIEAPSSGVRYREKTERTAAPGRSPVPNVRARSRHRASRAFMRGASTRRRTQPGARSQQRLRGIGVAVVDSQGGFRAVPGCCHGSAEHVDWPHCHRIAAGSKLHSL